MAKAVCTTPAPYERCRLAYSPLQRERLVTDCKNFLPDVLNGCPEALVQEAVPTSSGDVETIRSLFPSTFDTPLVNFAKGSEQFVASLTRSPMKVGVVLSGGQAPGGHNVIAYIRRHQAVA
jgi:pyrophosphate--fructose-6-phosphate 1-phosphotransferase